MGDHQLSEGGSGTDTSRKARKRKAKNMQTNPEASELQVENSIPALQFKINTPGVEDEGPTGLVNPTKAVKKRKRNIGPKNPVKKPINPKQPTIGKRLMQLEN